MLYTIWELLAGTFGRIDVSNNDMFLTLYTRFSISLCSYESDPCKDIYNARNLSCGGSMQGFAVLLNFHNSLKFQFGIYHANIWANPSASQNLSEFIYRQLFKWEIHHFYLGELISKYLNLLSHRFRHDKKIPNIRFLFITFKGDIV